MYSLNLGSKLVQNMGPSTFTETSESLRLLKICVNLSILVKATLFQVRRLKCLHSWMFDLATDLAHFWVRVVNPISIFARISELKIFTCISRVLLSRLITHIGTKKSLMGGLLTFIDIIINFL